MRCVSPWYNLTGWLGVKHYLLTVYLSLSLSLSHFLPFLDKKREKDPKTMRIIERLLHKTRHSNFTHFPQSQRSGTAQAERSPAHLGQGDLQSRWPGDDWRWAAVRSLPPDVRLHRPVAEQKKIKWMISVSYQQ